MTPDCLLKVQPLVSDTVFKKLKTAVDTGDQQLWDTTMLDSHADMKTLKRRATIDANRRNAVITYIQGQEKLGIKPQQALLDLLSGNSVRQKSGVVSLERYMEGVRGRFSAMNIDLIHATRPTMLANLHNYFRH